MVEVQKLKILFCFREREPASMCVSGLEYLGLDLLCIFNGRIMFVAVGNNSTNIYDSIPSMQNISSLWTFQVCPDTSLKFPTIHGQGKKGNRLIDQDVAI